MRNRGFSRIGPATPNLGKTTECSQNVLAFVPARGDIIKVKEGELVRHVLFNSGHGQLLAFMEPREVPGIAGDAGINHGLVMRIEQRLVLPLAMLDSRKQARMPQPRLGLEHVEGRKGHIARSRLGAARKEQKRLKGQQKQLI